MFLGGYNNLRNFTIWYLRVSVLLTVRLTTFGNHVRHIVIKCAEKEMVYIYAKPIVAMMENIEAICRAIYQFPGYSVGIFRFPIAVDLPIATTF